MDLNKIGEFFYNLVYSKKDEEIFNLNNQINDLNSKLNRVQNQIISDKLIKEYPSKLVYYSGRVLPKSTTRINVPVTVLITPTDMRIKQDLEKWGYLNSSEDTETLIPKIYKKVMETYYSYDSDDKVWGLKEFWEFPFELFAKYPSGKITADCDSFGILLISYLRAAGIPPGFVWGVVGTSSLGGHFTMYVHSNIDKKFHHLNSTSKNFYNKVSEYPTHKDAKEGKDPIGISDVWLSFNDMCSRSTFEDDEISKLLSGKVV